MLRPSGPSAVALETPHSGSTTLGIDEAGRGSVVGPLVVGGFLCHPGQAGDLVAAGVRDSKLLTPARREEVYGRLNDLGLRVSISVSPSQIDHAVRRGLLNHLEAEMFAALVRKTRPSEVFVDACDVNERRFGSRVARLARFTGPLVARHRADRDNPVVGAASIVAKVRRDRAVARLRSTLGPDLGSGYPSDTSTVAFLRKNLTPGGPLPSWVRASWATTERVIREHPNVTLERFSQ